MSRSRGFSLVVKSCLAVGLLSAAPARAALTATLDAPTDPVSYTGTADYTLTITNGPGSTATGVTVAVATLPPEIKNDADHVAVDASCAPVDPKQDGAFPCTVADLAPDGGKATVTISLTSLALGAKVPDPLPATCAEATAPIGPLTVNVTAAPGLSTSATSGAAPRKPFAVLTATTSGPATANVGDTIQYVNSVKNEGPCPSTNVQATLAGNSLIDNGLQKNEGDCTASAYPCVFDTLAPGQTVTWTSTFKVTGLAPGVMSEGTIALPEALTAASADVTDANDKVITPAVDDPGPDQGTSSAVTTRIPIGSHGNGCASAGGLGILGGLGLVLALARRRRARA